MAALTAELTRCGASKCWWLCRIAALAAQCLPPDTELGRVLRAALAAIGLVCLALTFDVQHILDRTVVVVVPALLLGLFAKGPDRLRSCHQRPRQDQGQGSMHLRAAKSCVRSCGDPSTRTSIESSER